MYICPICNKEFDNLPSYRGHKSSHFRGKNYRKGRKKIKPVGYYSTGKHICKYCNLEFESGPKLGGHLSTCEKNPNRIKNLKKMKEASSNRKGVSLSESHKEKMSKSLIGKTGGYYKGIGRGKKGWYKGYWCDSSYELAFVIFCIDHNLTIQKNNKRYAYKYLGKLHKYIPDFICENIFIEIKGYMSDKDKEKIRQFPEPIIVLYNQDLKLVFDYVEQMYGKDFINLYCQDG